MPVYLCHKSRDCCTDQQTRTALLVEKNYVWSGGCLIIFEFNILGLLVYSRRLIRLLLKDLVHLNGGSIEKETIGIIKQSTYFLIVSQALLTDNGLLLLHTVFLMMQVMMSQRMRWSPLVRRSGGDSFEG